MATSIANEKCTSVRGLGEIALRVNNLDAMQKFYEKVIGLPLMTRVPNCAFFKIAEILWELACPSGCCLSISNRKTKRCCNENYLDCACEAIVN
jgi:hypothetical protein